MKLNTDNLPHGSVCTHIHFIQVRISVDLLDLH